MTSEPSQHGWQPADRYEPTDEAPNQRGFGLFDAPAAPDEFPVFTPYSGSGREDDSPFPPDSDAAPSIPSFGGFPSDDIAAPVSDWTSSLSDQYVPAPAVVPIPGVRHDPEGSAPSWSTSSDFDVDPYPVPAAELDREDSSSGSSWAAFAAGDSPKIASSSGGGAWSEPSAPSWEDHPLNEQRREDPTRQEPSWGDPPSFGAPQPEAPQPVSPAVGSARVSAAAPVQHRPEPAPEAPQSPASRPAGRVYGSASVASPHSEPVADPAPYAAPPAPAMMPMQGAQPVRASARATVNVAKPNPGEAPPQITRSSTVYGTPTATPDSPAGPMSPQQMPPPMAPMAPAPMGAPAMTPPGHTAPPRQGRQPAFGDLLGPAAAAAAPEAPPMMPPNTAPPMPGPIPGQMPGHMPGQIPGQRVPGGPGMPPMGAPPPPAMGQGAVPSAMGQGAVPSAAQRASASVPSNREPSQSAFDQFKPATPDTSAPAEPKPERKGGIIIGVLVGCVALLAIAFGGLFLVDKIFNGPSFVVGDCVKQSESVAVRADCGETGAFQVKAAVTSPDQCQDQSQPHVQQKDQILCLAPVGAAQATPTPSAVATPNQ